MTVNIPDSRNNPSMDPHPEIIEILPTSLLERNRQLVSELKGMARSLGLDFGWHYLLDLVWMINKLGQVDGKCIMDAGAGTGVVQWYLASKGAEVTSVDRTSRADLPPRYRKRFGVRGKRQEDLLPAGQVFVENFRSKSKLRAKLSSQARDLLGMVEVRRSPGQVIIYNQDLLNLADIADNSMDAVVAVSALEHNQPADLELVVEELIRVLKPAGSLLATLGAARDQDWFHKPSHGWCYTDASLRRLFHLSQDVPSNYDRYDELFTDLHECTELRDNLAKFYYQSGDNGMPWGVWDPQYQSVGVCKVKPG